MDIKQKSNPIKDEEFKIFLERDFSGRLEDVLLKSEIGKRIKILEELGLNISTSKIIDTYISQEGYTMDNVGNLVIDEKALHGIYVLQEHLISKNLNVDISKIDDISVLRQIISNPKYKNSINQYGVEITNEIYYQSPEERKYIKEFYSKGGLEAIFKEIEIEPTPDIMEIFRRNLPSRELKEHIKNNPIFNFTDEEIEEIAKKLEEQTINSSLENKVSTQGMRHLYRLRDAVNQKEYNSEISTETEIKACIEELEKILPDFQYKDFIVDENGSISVDKSVDFLNNWEKIRNETKLTEDLIATSHSDFSKVDSDNLPKFLILIERAAKGQKQENKEIALKIAKQLNDVSGIELFNGDELDRQKIERLYSDILDGLDIHDSIDQIEWNENTAEGKLNRIDIAIDNDLGIRRDSRDQVNLSKDLASEILERQKQDKQKAIEKILLQENCSPEQIVALFYEFRYEELAQNRKKFEKFGPNQLKDSMEHGIARLIETHMRNNQELFGQYFTKNGNLSGIKIEELIQKNEFTNLQRVGISNAHKLIEDKVKDVEKSKNVDIKKSNELLNLIEKIRGKSKDEISDKERTEIFEMAAKLGKHNSLSKVIMRELIWIDKEQFKEMYAKLKGNEGKNHRINWVKRTFSDLKKGMIDLPKMMMKSSSKQQEGILATKINTMAKKVKEQKEKITQKVALGNTKSQENNDAKSNLPVVKKVSFWDKIKSAFSAKKMESKEIDDTKQSNQDENDKAVNNQESEGSKDILTTTEKSDTTITAQTGGLDYLKVETTPTFKETSKVVEANEQNQIDNSKTEELEIGE